MRVCGTVMKVIRQANTTLGKRSDLSKGRNFAFTLLEVLVVVSILTLLVTLVFPSFIAAKSRAKVVKSIAQMRQIHLAYYQYRIDFQFDDNMIAAYGTGLPGVLSISQLGLNNIADTGGNPTPWPAARYAVPQPIPGMPNTAIDNWNDYASTGQPMICIVDYTHNSGNPRDDIAKLRVAYGVFMDGRLARKESRGVLTRLSLWQQLEEVP